MEAEQQRNTPLIRKVKQLRRDISGLIREVEGNYNNPEMQQVGMKLKEAKHWAGEHLKNLGHELPEKFRDE